MRYPAAEKLGFLKLLKTFRGLKNERRRETRSWPTARFSHPPSRKIADEAASSGKVLPFPFCWTF